MWREIIYKVYGNYVIKANETILYLNQGKTISISFSTSLFLVIIAK